jgi:hypothetical protein
MYASIGVRINTAIKMILMSLRYLAFEPENIIQNPKITAEAPKKYTKYAKI